MLLGTHTYKYENRGEAIRRALAVAVLTWDPRTCDCCLLQPMSIVAAARRSASRSASGGLVGREHWPAFVNIWSFRYVWGFGVLGVL